MQDGAKDAAMNDNMPTENDLPDEDILAMWDEGKPVQLAHPGPHAALAWTRLGNSDSDAGRSSLVIRRTLDDAISWRPTDIPPSSRAQTSQEQGASRNQRLGV